MAPHSPSLIEQVVTHVCLPRQPPARREDDRTVVEIDHDISKRAVDTAAHLAQLSQKDESLAATWTLLQEQIQLCNTLNRTGHLETSQILLAFKQIHKKAYIIAQIVQQNAGLLIYLDPRNQDNVVIESFELSPTSIAVLAAQQSLIRHFPGIACAVPLTCFEDPAFQQELATHLSKASFESINRFEAKTRRRGMEISEIRDTSSPTLVTHLLSALLEALGSRVSPQILVKRTRDEVVYEPGAEKPWRRSSFWLLLRVGIQRYLYQTLGQEAGYAYYKAFMCVLLARLLDDAWGKMSPDLPLELNKKLGRRLLKLQRDRDQMQVCDQQLCIYDNLLELLEPICRVIQRRVIQAANDVYKAPSSGRPLKLSQFQMFAPDPDQVLSLRSSREYITAVLERPLPDLRRTTAISLASVVQSGSKNVFHQLDRYRRLAQQEQRLEEFCSASASEHPPLGTCEKLMEKIENYLVSASAAYNKNQEQTSQKLLTVMELWVCLDKIATGLFPLLENYRPLFPEAILNDLQIPTLHDMNRVQNNEMHLTSRHQASKSNMTIFADPVEGCFAEQWFDHSVYSQTLSDLRERIHATNEQRIEQKREEWELKLADYRKLCKNFEEHSCVYMATPRPASDIPSDHDPECKKCKLGIKIFRLRIERHEHLLPGSEVEAKALLAEYRYPQELVAYRDITWKIGRLLAGLESNKNPRSVVCLAREYQHFQEYHALAQGSITLGSSQKGHNRTHYRYCRANTESFDQIVLKCSLRLAYCETLTSADGMQHVWLAAQSQVPTISHYFPFEIPTTSPFAALTFAPEFKLSSEGPTSNQVISAQSKCPQGVGYHEYNSFLELSFGKEIRWIQIIRELASANLNFSTEAVMMLVSRLALHAGPPNRYDVRRTCHTIFTDPVFCDKLLQELSVRVTSASHSWRETAAMDLLLTLTLRLLSLTTDETVRESACSLIEKIREATFEWIQILRDSIWKSTNLQESVTFSRYVLLAALLCKRTFQQYAETKESLTEHHLKRLLTATMVVHDNLPSSMASASYHVKTALSRDLRLMVKINSQIKAALNHHTFGVVAAISETWPGLGLGESTLADVPRVDPNYPEWIHIDNVLPKIGRHQYVHLNWVRGYLLIDGQPVGVLPSEHRAHPTLKELFGDQVLFTCPSDMLGMTYKLALNVFGHQVHFGFRGDKFIVRTLQVTSVSRPGSQQNHSLSVVKELIPREIFGTGAQSFDLPAQLIQNCCHWINLFSGSVEIRPLSNIWKERSSNWYLENLFSSQPVARRREAFLVDVRSSTFNSMARIFERIEDRSHIVVAQPPKRPIVVELRRLDLSFLAKSVTQFDGNKENILYCPGLDAELDPDQDIGTWYGLQSMLVVRDTKNPRRRRILVSMGDVVTRRFGIHVSVDLARDGTYGIFSVNSMLGRIECETDPRLLFTKALIYAYTSRPVPDELTSKTGTEEALSCLKSGCVQPYQPIRPFHKSILDAIASLTPKRSWYPEDMKILQKVSWKQDLPKTIQNEELRSAVERLVQRSNRLAKFWVPEPAPLVLESDSDAYLMQRALSSASRFQRSDAGPLTAHNMQACYYEMQGDDLYSARDIVHANEQRQSTYEITRLLSAWPSRLMTYASSSSIFSKPAIIRGFVHEFEIVLLNDLLATDLVRDWGPLVNMCRAMDLTTKMRLIFIFAILAFDRQSEMALIRMIVGFAIFQDLKEIKLPDPASYIDFVYQERPRKPQLVELIGKYGVPYLGPREPAPGSLNNLRVRQHLQELEKIHNDQIRADAEQLATVVLRDWPKLEFDDEDYKAQTFIETSDALSAVREECERLGNNMDLSNHLDEMMNIFCSRSHDAYTPERAQPMPHLTFYQERVRGNETLNLAHLVSIAQLPAANSLNERECFLSSTVKPATKGATLADPLISTLEKVIQPFQRQKSRVRIKYAEHLLASAAALRNLSSSSNQKALLSLSDVKAAVEEARIQVDSHFNAILEALRSTTLDIHGLEYSNLAPPITMLALLELLGTRKQAWLPQSSKKCLIECGLALTSLQKWSRIDDHLRRNQYNKARDELNNIGHEAWNPFDFPDWLLLEIDANFLLRPKQVVVAEQTIAPATRSNTLLQLQMGQGKSSCIVPAAAATLANGKRLMRTVVPKALLSRSAKTMQHRLGGLLGRSILHIPFSRRTPTTASLINEFFALHNEAMKSGDVVIVLPEHIMSFKLYGLQKLSDEKLKDAKRMLEIQEWLDGNSRDILDESDHTLATQVQLIYPGGARMTVDGSPQRWEVTETLLRLAQSHFPSLKNRFGPSFHFFSRVRGTYPSVFFLGKEVEMALVDDLVGDVMRGSIPTIPLSKCNVQQLAAIKEFIGSATASKAINWRVDAIFAGNLAALQTLYLIRGLLVHRLLLTALKKRWNVEYGMHPERPGLSVPFHAKGWPSEAAEWGHPDFAILATALSHNYGGLSVAQLQESLRHVKQTDDPSGEYQRWIDGQARLPSNLRDWSGINVEDESQALELHQYLARNTVVIKHYLDHLIFPRYAKQYTTKLVTSAWDIINTPIACGTGCAIDRPQTTGFSGTAMRILLPFSIQQHDIPELMHTDAEVLLFLLQPRNNAYRKAFNESTGLPLTEWDFLRSLSAAHGENAGRSGTEISVLIDAGALIMEMDNLSLAKAWLQVSGRKQAAIYFNEDDDLWVVTRSGKKMPFKVSSFVDNLAECVVYFSQANCRGTDVPLPPNAHAALTLSLGQQKDATVQAAMRLRQLGTTQRVTWFATGEVHQSIIDHQVALHGPSKQRDLIIDSAKIISWLIDQTCSRLESLIPLFYVQGRSFCQRTQAARDNPDCLTDFRQREKYLSVLRQPERLNLRDMYGSDHRVKSAKKTMVFGPRLKGMISELEECKRSFDDSDANAVHASAHEVVEQEVQQEQENEVEQEREVQRPSKWDPLVFKGLHADLHTFLKTGFLPVYSQAVELAFNSLKRTGPGQRYRINEKATSCKLFASIEYTRTVAIPPAQSGDGFLRQPNWVLWSTQTEIAVLVCPEEAESLVPLIRQRASPKVYLLTYAAPVIRRMLGFDNFGLYNIPATPLGWQAPTWLKVELGFFAGRLYLEWEEYQTLRCLLDVNDSSEGTVTGEAIAKNPISLLQELLDLRRKGQDVSTTPMGYISQGKILYADHAFFGGTSEANAMEEQPYVEANRDEFLIEDEFDDEE